MGRQLLSLLFDMDGAVERGWMVACGAAAEEPRPVGAPSQGIRRILGVGL